MPLITSTYKAPLWIGGKHAQTIIPGLFRKVTGVSYTRERILTADDDFLDLDWSKVGGDKLIILSHGLESNSQAPYILGMVKEFNARGWDALAWNLRGCSGELNRSIRFYHGGSIHDLEAVVNRGCEQKYKKIYLIGFSYGANITLKYLGDKTKDLPSQIKSACVFSVPCDLYAAARNLSRGINRIYFNYFFRSLKAKAKKKFALYPGLHGTFDIDKIKDFVDFDNYYTAPMWGYKDATHYYLECSSKYSIPKIGVSTLIVNALNDPFMHPACFPHEACQKSESVILECPYDGGHQGFIKNRLNGTYWSEERAILFFEDGR